MAEDRYVVHIRMDQANALTCSSGSLNELLGDHEGALFAYEQALRHNQWSTQTLNSISSILRTKEKYPEAMDYLKNILKVEPANGEAWGNLGEALHDHVPHHLTLIRPLLLDDGQFTGGVHSISAGIILLAQAQRKLAFSNA
jgi:tetratricopeptide (TPR) repeat protein